MGKLGTKDVNGTNVAMYHWDRINSMYEDSVETNIIHKEDLKKVHTALREIKQNNLKTLTKRYVRGWTFKEIAEEEKVSMTGVLARGHRAKKEFKEVYTNRI